MLGIYHVPFYYLKKVNFLNTELFEIKNIDDLY